MTSLFQYGCLMKHNKESLQIFSFLNKKKAKNGILSVRNQSSKEDKGFCDQVRTIEASDLCVLCFFYEENVLFGPFESLN